MPNPRLSYEESCGVLRERGYLDASDVPKMANRRPQADDSEFLGVRFYRTFVGEGEKLEDLTLPRTFFGRTEINDASFKNTDLRESYLCWNDFVNVDFSDAVLARSEMRASQYENVRFVRTDLRGADMRLSDYDGCRFDDALMDGAVLTHDQREQIELSDAQQAVIDWRDEDGPEPDGG